MLIQKAFRNLHPLIQFIFIICVALSGMGLAVFFGTFISAWFCGTGSSLTELTSAMGNLESNTGICANLVLNTINQILAFGAAGLAFTILHGSAPGVGFSSKGKNLNLNKFLIGAVIITFGFSPFLDLTYRLNEWLLVDGSTIHTMAAALEAEVKIVRSTLQQVLASFPSRGLLT